MARKKRGENEKDPQGRMRFGEKYLRSHPDHTNGQIAQAGAKAGYKIWTARVFAEIRKAVKRKGQPKTQRTNGVKVSKGAPKAAKATGLLSRLAAEIDSLQAQLDQKRDELRGLLR